MNVRSSCFDLALGTAQLGMRYGVNNVAGQPDYATVREIVTEAWGRGVRFFDTAQAYGSSEEVLGRAFEDLGIHSEVCVISKVSPNISLANPDEFLDSLENSLKRLRIPRLWGVMLHREGMLDVWDVAMETFERAQRVGIAERVGVSIYSSSRALEALGKYGLDIVQVPANVFDRRMERAGVFAHAKKCGKVVFIRSVYLQGLALMSPQSTPAQIPFAKDATEVLQQFCVQHELNRKQFAMAHVRHLAPEGKLVIGAETAAQVRENCALFEACSLNPHLHSAWTARWPDDIESLVDPSRW